MKPEFSWAAWIVGLIVALAGGSLLNFAFAFASFSTGHTMFAILMLLIPGAAIALIGWRVHWREGLGQGMIVGGCIIALAGGICGFTLTS